MLHPSTRARFKRIVPLLLMWHEKNQRSFIWRGLRRSPYVVLVSEYMLQQTGVKQVEKKLPEFLKQFPSVKKLAAAPRSDVLRAWQGLGYNRRALNLLHAAKVISKKGRFPKTLEGLQELPGVGLYTASAILAFAHNADTPVVDVNIKRVLSRLWKPMKTPTDSLPMRDINKLDREILPHGHSSDWHEALMDLGSTICTKRTPKCSICPIRPLCPSARGMKMSSKKLSTIQERHYFGQPRRIWRGRILKFIAEGSPITIRKLSTILKKEFRIAEPSFVPFVVSVLETLKKEGFLSQTRKGALSLAHD